MTVVYPAARPVAQLDMPDAALHRKVIAETANRAMRGHLNAVAFVTLDAGAATTVITDPRISAQTSVGMVPQTAHAATEIPTMWVVCASGQATIHHTNSGVTDRVFTASMVG